MCVDGVRPFFFYSLEIEKIFSICVLDNVLRELKEKIYGSEAIWDNTWRVFVFLFKFFIIILDYFNVLYQK